MMKKVIKKLARKSAPKSKKTVKGTRKKPSGGVSPEELYAMIEKKAFELYEKRGFSHGDDQADWYRAEKSVLTSIKKK